MTDNEIKAADAIFKTGSKYGTTLQQVFTSNLTTVSDIDYIIHAADILEKNGHIVISKDETNQDVYSLTVLGIEFQRSGKSYANFLKEQEEKQTKLDEKEELVLQDYRDKVQNLNPAQLNVLKTTTPRHHQILMMTVIGVLLTAILGILIRWVFGG
jgi:predicted transcriptional regulator